MQISPFFQNLRSAYVAEMQDMSYDSEGLFILNQRLAQRRGEIEFLVHMIEISPEMVSVVFHKAFRFTSMAVMDDLLTQDPEALPSWDSLADTIDITLWAQALVQTLRSQPSGDWLLTVAAGLEYMLDKPAHAHGTSSDDDSDAQDKTDDARSDARYRSTDDEEADAQDREDAGADWMVEQGFDRKD